MLAWNRKLRESVVLLDQASLCPMDCPMRRKTMIVGTLQPFDVSGEPPGTRTQGPRLKRAMLYRLS
ncbi:protein of unknown function [Nitrospira japonica]|uniref:Uncharacterized protein n=1 Tax=Nitrospira japonica TaxID=1325564 RepID=A0A1W1I0R3_9BACT|nr:protein of unknown function [Nitrospira japonica]